MICLLTALVFLSAPNDPPDNEILTAQIEEQFYLLEAQIDAVEFDDLDDDTALEIEGDTMPDDVDDMIMLIEMELEDDDAEW